MLIYRLSNIFSVISPTPTVETTEAAQAAAIVMSLSTADMVMSALVGLVVPGRYLIDNPKYVVWCHTYEGNFRFNITPRLNWGKKDLWRFFLSRKGSHFYYY